MRNTSTNKILLLQGVPGAGKSTWIKENRLENYTISLDSLRLMFGGLDLNERGEMVISSSKETYKLANQALDNMLKTRMKNGTFIVLDKTHTTQSSIDKVHELAKMYNYEIYIKKINISLEDAINIQEQREPEKKVPTSVVAKMYENLKKFVLPEYATYIDNISELSLDFLSSEEVSSDKSNKYMDLSDYEDVMVIGDVHGCYDILLKAIDYQIDNKKFYIFSGDLVDRGPSNDKMIQFILQNQNKSNVVFVCGNHDRHIINYLAGEEVPEQFMKDTSKYIDKLDKQQKNKIRKAFTNYFLFSYKGQKYQVTHAGMLQPNLNLSMLNNTMLEKGLGGYRIEVGEIYESHNPDVIQLHGHRKCNSTPHSICLEDRVEFGGHLVVYSTNKGIEYIN